MKRKYIAIIVILIIIAGTTYYFIRKRSTPTVSRTPYVEVTKGNISMTVDGTGNLDTDKRVITLKGSGTVKKVYHKVGDKVKAGELLYQIEDDNLNTQLKDALINVELAQQQLDNDMKSYNDTISKQKIVSQYSGIVDSISVKVGQDVSSGATIATVIDYSTATVKVPFNGSQIKNIKTGQSADVYLYSSYVTVKGTVTDVSTEAVPVNGASYYYVTVSLSNPGALTDGTTAQVTVHTNSGDMRAIENGTLSVKDTNTITSQIQGTVASINVKEGQKISAGTLIATLTTTVDDTTIKKDQLNLQQAQNSYNNIQSQISDLSIYAPIDGTIISQNINEGDELSGSSSSNTSTSSISSSSSSSSSSGSSTSVSNLSSVYDQSETAIIVNNNSYSVDVPIDETDISKIKIGQKATLTTDDLQGETFEGTVIEISSVPTIQNNVASYDVTVSLPYTDKLKLGQTMNVSIIVSEKNNTLMLPIEAVQTNGNSKYVVLYDENSSKNSDSKTKNIKQVTTGIYNDKYIEILSGLSEGDKVLISSSGTSNSTSTNSRNNQRSGFGAIGGGGMPPMK
ncbi:HlyD family efflux transporter periplasmic adaptor subunit [Thermoanaerobacterium sp. CMT5567-10]|uniref:HlyD family efflux transporter periplasmic adaptor subunit n=1 Tax=Thermoanaerobacterium sp. CMT5567-10 TaxID=3061989 RepID=UPI0026DF8987|nr:HlyD family efflux transporter periplasmic adaptor subunit [Thermoanaerobacterium sp. CMT5567-10]WKV08028.1 HlyD family efflux transporter periplasmic adaptor subunit [Thermoanaerobacterium sp. CMT5567-10]